MGSKRPSDFPKLQIHPAFFRRVAYYRDRIGIHDGRPQVARKFVEASERVVLTLLQNPHRGHLAGFEDRELADILRVSIPGFAIFAVFYRYDGETVTVVTLEHTAQDLPSRLAAVLAR